MRALASSGELVTKLLTFAGNGLTLNFSTSAAGSIRVGLQQPDGEPAPGFSLADCQEVFGDEHQRTVTRSGGSDLSGVSGRPVRLHFVLRARICFRLSLSSSPAIALPGAGHGYHVVNACPGRARRAEMNQSEQEQKDDHAARSAPLPPIDRLRGAHAGSLGRRERVGRGNPCGFLRRRRARGPFRILRITADVSHPPRG